MSKAAKVAIGYPSRFRLSLDEVAANCEWQIDVSEGRILAQPLDDPVAPGLLVPHVSTTQTESGVMTLDLEPIDDWMGIDDPNLLAPRLRRLMNDAQSPEARWGHARNFLQVVPTRDLRMEVTALWARISSDVPGSTLMAVTTKRAISWRNSLLAGLLTNELTPERLKIPDSDFVGFDAGRGMTGPYTYGAQFLIEPFLLARSPRLIGLPFPRVGGVLCALFPTARLAVGEGQGGRRSLELLHASSWPAIHNVVSDLGEKLPPPVPAFQWWVRQADVLLSALLDPRRFRKDGGKHDPVAQTAEILNMIRLFSTVQTLLVEPITNATARLSLLFDVLDLMQTSGMGGYDVLCHPGVVRRQYDGLQKLLPPDVGALLLPKCERAVMALGDVGSEFFCAETINGQRAIRLPGAGPTPDVIPLDAAVSRYLRLMRNARHGFAQRVLRDQAQRALYGCHSGQLPGELADLAFLHLVRVLAQPQSLRFARNLPT